MPVACKRNLACLTVSLIFLAAGFGAAAQDTFKLYINKTQNPDNVVVLKNEFSTVVKHTTDGIELEFPGVNVVFRCKSNTAQIDNECTIAVQQGDAGGGGGGGGGGNLPALTPTFATPTATESGFTVRVSNHSTAYIWNVSSSPGSATINSSGLITVTGLSASESATVTVTTTRVGYDVGSATVAGTASAGSGGGGGGGGDGGGTASCTSGGGIECAGFDAGPAGATNINKNDMVAGPVAGAVLVYPFSVASNTGGGSVSWGPTFNVSPTNGANLRVWFSSTPRGAPVEYDCTVVGASGAFSWSGGSGGCTLGSNTAYYLNLEACVAPSTNRSCTGNVAAADDKFEVYLTITP